MWVVAGVLLGLVVLAAVVGFHTGPHAHAAAGLLGLVAAGWLVAMALEGRTAPLLWALLSADLVVSGGVGILAWKGLKAPHSMAGRSLDLEGVEGVAVTDLTPEGIVRIRGEQWSAVCVNGTVPAGSPVQVLRSGVRLEVWGEHQPAASPSDALPFGEAGPRGASS